MKCYMIKVSPDEVTKEVMDSMSAIQMMSKLGYKFVRAFNSQYKYQDYTRAMVFEKAGSTTFYQIFMCK